MFNLWKKILTKPLTMIKELRIGNFVNKVNRDHLIHFPESEVLVIQEIGYDCVVYPLGSNPANLSRMPIVYCGDLSPISLTEDWFLKFGFEKSWDYWMKSNSNFFFGITEKGDLMYLFDEDMICPAKIKHVHELQNLYFALVGEELKIKETAQ